MVFDRYLPPPAAPPFSKSTSTASAAFTVVICRLLHGHRQKNKKRHRQRRFYRLTLPVSSFPSSFLTFFHLYHSKSKTRLLSWLCRRIKLWCSLAWGLDSRSESQYLQATATAGPGLLLDSSNPTHYGVPTLGSLGPGNTPDSSKARPPRPDLSESFLFLCDISLLLSLVSSSYLVYLLTCIRWSWRERRERIFCEEPFVRVCLEVICLFIVQLERKEKSTSFMML